MLIKTLTAPIDVTFTFSKSLFTAQFWIFYKFWSHQPAAEKGKISYKWYSFNYVHSNV